MTMAHLLEADHISKYYGNIVALKDISTYVNAGEVTCILGDNGAGKSSFIKILSGVHQADEGRPGEGDRHRLPGSGDGSADVRLAELLPRCGTSEGIWSDPVVRLGEGEE